VSDDPDLDRVKFIIFLVVFFWLAAVCAARVPGW
jgi:hypothetical protein